MITDHEELPSFLKGERRAQPLNEKLYFFDTNRWSSV
jgi:hypothetical protein